MYKYLLFIGDGYNWQNGIPFRDRLGPFFRREAGQRSGEALVVLMSFAVFLSSFWLGDDSFITFRTLDNFVNGYGLRWNVDERVQSFTNPLWLFFLSPIYLLIREIYVTAFAGTLAIFVGILWLLVRHNKGHLHLLILFSLLLLSRSFVEYLSSGLENSLSYFLIALYFYNFIEHVNMHSGRFHTKSGWKLSLIYSLLILNRMDLSLLLFFPHLWLGVSCLLQRDSNRSKDISMFLAGLLPVLFWLAFSVVYFGFPFPNTYYAKTGFSLEGVRWSWVSGYYRYALNLDPLLLMIPLFAIFLTVMKRQWFFLLFASGIVLQNLYIIQIGGDFMGGRWLTAPFLLAVLILARISPITILHRFNVGQAIIAMILTVIVYEAQYRMLRYNPFAEGTKANVFIYNGVIDERQGWGAFTGLRGCLTGKLCYQDLATWKAGDELKKSGQKIAVGAAIGFYGFAAGPRVKIIDAQGLSDPLLARLECAPHAPGHCPREIPPGYGKDGHPIEDGRMADYFKGLHLIVSGDIFSEDRRAYLVEYNLGKRKSWNSFMQSEASETSDVNRDTSEIRKASSSLD